MMRVALLLLPAVALFAGTCTTDVRQLGEAGPWTGIVTNTGDATISGMSVDAIVRDAEGNALRHFAAACPSVLLPGERAALAIRVHPDERLGGRLPFHADVDVPAYAQDPGGMYSIGLHAREVSRDAARRTVRVQVTNNGDARYVEPGLCAIGVRDDGTIVGVSQVRSVFPDNPLAGISILPPRASATVDLSFPDGLPETVLLYPQGQVEGQAPCCVPPNGDGGWQAIDTGPFNVLLPPDWDYEPLQGIDSFVGRFTGDGVELLFDYGWYSNTLPYDADPRYHVHFESVGGREAKFVYPESGDGETGVYFPEVLNAAPGPQRIQSVVQLNLIGQNLTPTQRELATQIFRSVRFGEP